MKRFFRFRRAIRPIAADAQIDQALRLLVPTEAPAGLESRIHARLRSAEQAGARKRSWTLAHAAMAVMAVAVGIGAADALHRSSTRLSAGGTARALRAPAPAAQARPPVTSTSGIQTSAARRVPTQPVEAAGRSRNQRHPGAGRASIARDAHRAPGIATPAN